MPARYLAARPGVVTVDPSGTLTGQSAAPDTARVTGYLPMGFSSSLLVRLVLGIDSVRVAPATLTVALGAAPAFTATAYVASGPVAGPVFAWASSDTLVARVDPSGVATTLSTGVATITATTEGVAGAATLTVTTPVGVTRTWVGGDAAGPTDWSNASNWTPVGVPATNDSIRIVNAASAPSLSANATVSRLIIDGSNLTLNGHRLTVSGAFRTGETSSNGALTMQHPADTLAVGGDATFAGAPLPGRLTAGVLLVGGNFRQIYVGGNWDAFQASGSHRTVFNGAVAQSIAFDNPGTAGQSSFFHDLVVANPAGAVFTTNAAANGKLRVTAAATVSGAGTVTVADSIVTVAGSSVTTGGMRLSGGMAVGGSFSPALTEFFGSGTVIQPGLGYESVLVTGQVSLGGTTSLAGSLTVFHIVNQPTGDLTLAGHKLTVGGSLTTGVGNDARGVLTMQNAADTLVVLGNATFAGAPLPGRLTAGVFLVAGDFQQVYIGSNWEGFQASGTHRTVLNGTAAQSVSFTNPGASGQSSFFHHLEIANAAGVTFSTNAVANGKLRISAAAAVSGAGTVTVGDSIISVTGSSVSANGMRLGGGMAISGSFSPALTEFFGSGSLIQSGLGYQSVLVTGQVSLSGTTTVAGNLTLFHIANQPTGDLNLAGQKLTVGGNLTTGSGSSASGRLTMQDPADSLIVAGNVLFAGAPLPGRLTAGVLAVGGDFRQAYIGSNWDGFQASGSHRTEFNGTASQTIQFDNPGTAGQSSFFADVTFANAGGGITLLTPAVANGVLRSGAQTVASSGHALTAGGVDVNGLTLDNTAFAIGAGAIGRFDSVTFQGLAPTATQFAIAHPGAAAPFTFTGTRFLVAPTTGAYVNATDLAPSDGQVLTVTLADPDPADGSAFTTTSGGAVVNWGTPSGPFAPTGSLTDARYSHGSVLLQSGRVLTVGGLSTRGELYDTATGTFTPTTGSITLFRDGLTATTLYDGRVLITGGGQIFPATTRTAELYDPATQVFTLTDSLGDSIPAQARGRRYHTATLLGDGRVIVVGGEGVANSVLYRLRSAESYSPISETFTVLASPARARGRHTASLLPNGRILIAGGQTNFVDTGDPQAEIYDPTTNTWANTGVMVSARNEGTATVLADGRVLLTGGSALRQDQSFRRRSAEIYDPATGAFTATDSMAFRRQFHTATLLVGSRVLIVGGLDQNNQPVMTAELYDPATGTFTTAGPVTTFRDRHAAVRLPDGRVLITGGINGGNTAELYTP